MRIISVKHGHAQNTIYAELTEEEKKLPHYELINLADARGDPQRAKDIYNFGGKVTPLPDGTTEIIVYID